jgi:hypothetical protein
MRNPGSTAPVWIASFIVAACGGDEATAPVDAGPPGEARVRAIHLSPDAPAVDLFVNAADEPAFTALSFTDSREYEAIPAATYDFTIVPAGAPLADAMARIQGFELTADTLYSIAVHGELDTIRALAVVDDDAGLAEADIRVRAFHVAPALGTLDIWRISDAGEPEAIYTNVAYGQAGDPIDLAAAAHTLGVDVDRDGAPDVVFELPELPGGTFVNLFAASDMAGDPFLVAQLPRGDTARIEGQ